MEKQVDDLRRTINEEVDRFAQSAKNDLTRARDFEASLNKALDAQKRQSVQLSQASVRLRELERDVEASRDIYQSFLKRSRETEEQESLNTSSARVIGEATVPRRRTFPPGMSLIAMIGFVFGALAAGAWVIAADRLPPDASDPLAVRSETRQPAMSPPSKPPFADQARQQAPVALIEKPLIARLQESDVVRTLSGILKANGAPDLTRLGWPTLRAGFPMTTFLNAMREMRATLAKRQPASAMPVMAMIGAGAGEDRSIAVLNVAIAAARDGARVLVIDADHGTHALSTKMNGFGQSEASRLSWLSIGTKASRAIKTANGISILPVIKGSDTKAGEAIRKTIAQARSAGGYDLVILDGPAMPWSAADRTLLEIADGIVAILPARLDINDCMEDIIAALGGAQRKLIGVILNELNPAAVNRKRDKRYA
jgi:Mrp family chromosome partitioning ATPase